jgi:hypothetical protein
MKKNTCFALPLICRIVYLGLLFFSIYQMASSQKFQNGIFGTIILWDSTASHKDSIDQQSFFTTLESIGFDVVRIAPSDFIEQPLYPNTLLVIPNISARSLSGKTIQAIIKSMQLGLTLVTDGESPLSKAMGIKLGKDVRVVKLVDHLLPKLKPHWADTSRVAWIANYLGRRKDILVSDRDNGHPLVIQKHFGKGGCLYFAPLFDPISGKGYARFANFPYTIVNELHREPVLRRKGADAYFDPGFRRNIPIETLARRWHKWGIRAIHAAAWNFYDRTPYDYARLIKASHQNGILVYAWLEWPYVGRKFWDLHPEWRQKNALLQDAHLDFLYLMDLQNPLCMQAAMNDLKRLLENDWDGIDIAEFSITGVGKEALEGPLRAEDFTGFTSTGRTEFKKLFGFDQLELFDTTSIHYWMKDSSALNTFYRYRVLVNNRLLRQIVKDLDSLNKQQKRNWEMILTITDNTLHPEFNQLLGYDVPNMIRLIKEYNIALEVEDPYTEWTKPPERYTRLAETYRQLLQDHPFMIDINIVPVHPLEQEGYSYSQPTGSEIFQLFRAASDQNHRVCFYSESTVFTHDWELLPLVMAAKASIRKKGAEWIINTPYTVILTHMQINDRFLLDGQPWLCYSEEGILIPGGTHRLSRREAQDTSNSWRSGIRLVSLSDELLDCRKKNDTLEVKYVSPAHCALTMSERPAVMILDGVLVDLPIVQNADRVIVFAPPGLHRIAMVSQ